MPPALAARTMHSIEKNGLNAGCVEVIQVPLITPEEFVGRGRGAEEHMTEAKGSLYPSSIEWLEEGPILAALKLHLVS